MGMIEIRQLENGAHRNQTAVYPLPDGWAIIPDDLPCENYPFGDVTTEEINGVMTVTSWSPLPMPENEEENEQPSQLDRIEAQVMFTALMTDTLIEEGV